MQPKYEAFNIIHEFDENDSLCLKVCDESFVESFHFDSKAILCLPNEELQSQELLAGLDTTYFCEEEIIEQFLSSIEEGDFKEKDLGINSLHALSLDREFVDLILVKDVEVVLAKLDPMHDEVSLYSEISSNAENYFKNDGLNSGDCENDAAFSLGISEHYFFHPEI